VTHSSPLSPIKQDDSYKKFQHCSNKALHSKTSANLESLAACVVVHNNIRDILESDALQSKETAEQ
jgi:hypothetical protein